MFSLDDEGSRFLWSVNSHKILFYILSTEHSHGVSGWHLTKFFLTCIAPIGEHVQERLCTSDTDDPVLDFIYRNAAVI
jgi:hypothetical protein